MVKAQKIKEFKKNLSLLLSKKIVDTFLLNEKKPQLEVKIAKNTIDN